MKNITAIVIFWSLIFGCSGSETELENLRFEKTIYVSALAGIDEEVITKLKDVDWIYIAYAPGYGEWNVHIFMSTGFDETIEAQGESGELLTAWQGAVSRAMKYQECFKDLSE